LATRGAKRHPNGAGLADDLLKFGDFGIQAVESSHLTSRQIEAARIAMTRHIKRGGKVWILVYPDRPITKKPAESRVVSGQESPAWWIAKINPGRVLFELSGVEEDVAREAMRLAIHKLPLKARFIRRDRVRGIVPDPVERKRLQMPEPLGSYDASTARLAEPEATGNQHTSARAPAVSRSPLEMLRVMGARKFLLDVETQEAVSSAASSSPQAEIAHALGVSQATVSRMLARIQHDDPVSAQSREVLASIAEALATGADRSTLVDRVRSRHLEPGQRAPDGSDGYLAGPFDAVVDAWERGWISDAEYEQIAKG
jgi:large subunit ribosomal protein L16